MPSEKPQISWKIRKNMNRWVLASEEEFYFTDLREQEKPCWLELQLPKQVATSSEWLLHSLDNCTLAWDPKELDSYSNLPELTKRAVLYSLMKQMLQEAEPITLGNVTKQLPLLINFSMNQMALLLMSELWLLLLQIDQISLTKLYSGQEDST